MALTVAGPSFAGSSAPVSKSSAAHHRHHHRSGGDAAAAAAFAGMIGTVGAVAASQAYRDAYAYYGGPGYYAPSPAYYYGRPLYPEPYGGDPPGSDGYGFGRGSGSYLDHGSYLDPGENIIPY